MVLLYLVLSLCFLKIGPVKPKCLRELMGWPLPTLNELRRSLWESQKNDLCRQLMRFSLKRTWRISNEFCEETLDKFRQLPASEQYYCQRPSPPAKCTLTPTRRPIYRHFKYECTFEAQHFHFPSQRVENPVRFRARMEVCIHGIKKVRPQT